MRNNRIIQIVGLTILFISCSKDPEKRAVSYFPDMEKTTAYKAFSDSLLSDISENQTYPILRSSGMEGEKIYIEICSQCHGMNGKGKGFLYTSGLFNYPPADLTSKKIRSKSDSVLLNHAMNGFGVMGPQNQVLMREDIETTIDYVTNELK